MYRSGKDSSHFHSTSLVISKIHLFLHQILGKAKYSESYLVMMSTKDKTAHGTYKRKLPNSIMKTT